MTTDLVASYRQRISELHQQSVAADEKVREALSEKIEVTRQTGETIRAAHDDLRHQEFAAATDFLSSDAVKAYLKLARLHPEPVTDLETSLRTIRESMMLTGAIEFGSRGFQQFHTPDFVSTTIRTIQTVAANWSKVIRRRPLSQWRADEIDSALATFAPIQRILRMLNVEQQRRQK